MMKYVASLIVFLTIIAAVVYAGSGEVISLIELNNLSKSQYLSVKSQGLDVLEQRDQRLEILAYPNDLDFLNQNSIPYQTIYADYQAHIKSSRKALVPFGGFRTLAQIEAKLDSLAADYPNILTPKFSIGTTIEGRDQWVLKLSDNPEVDEDEPEVLYLALIHAREPAAGAAQIHFLEHMLSNYGTDPEITDLIDNRELFFLPVQNPDGYYHNEVTDPDGGGMWRKNRRDNGDGTTGVDLNRNYGFQWAYDDIGSSGITDGATYRGTAPFSEPETANVRDFIISRNFVITRNMHCYSNLEIWPYGYDYIYTDQEPFYAALGDSMTQYNGYNPGVGWTLYVTNGDADDWAWGDTLSKPRIISITCEIGGSSDGFWPDPSRIPQLVDENIFPNLYIAKIADAPYDISPPKRPMLAGTDSSLGDYQINWLHEDTLNPAVAYDLWEYSGKTKTVDDVETSDLFWDAVSFNKVDTVSHNGSYCWSTENLNGVSHQLMSADPYLVKVNDSLKFWINYDIEPDWDYFYAQVSTDDGITFDNLANDLTTNTNPNGNNRGNGITGTSPGWIETKFDLSLYEGQEVIFNLAYVTDNYVLNDGVLIDDIENVEYFSVKSEIATAAVDTFYQFSGKVPDIYWYRVLAVDAQDQESQFSNYATVLVYSEDVILYGDVNKDGTFDIADIVFFIDYMFNGGDEPTDLTVVDVNCDGSIDITDLVMMIDYMFNQGDPLGC